MEKIKTIDLKFQGLSSTIAAYLIEGPEGLVLIETGPGSTQTRLEDEIVSLGHRLEDIEHILVTHIHLDHAGAAGWLAKNGAMVYVHHVGAPHLKDPSRLLASAGRLYGDEMDKLWGEMLPVPEAQIVELHDGDVVEAAGLKIVALDTPGHAYHHMSFALGKVAFTGDVGGACVPGFNLVGLPSPPPEINIDAWHESVARLIALNFQKIYPTHFGEVTDVHEHLAALDDLMDESSHYVWELMKRGREKPEIEAAYRQKEMERMEAAGFTPEAIEQYEAANPIDMSVAGLMRYWRKKKGLG